MSVQHHHYRYHGPRPLRQMSIHQHRYHGPHPLRQMSIRLADYSNELRLALPSQNPCDCLQAVI
jgi:hypothetical protein